MGSFMTISHTHLGVLGAAPWSPKKVAGGSSGVSKIQTLREMNDSVCPET